MSTKLDPEIPYNQLVEFQYSRLIAKLDRVKQKLAHYPSHLASLVDPNEDDMIDILNDSEAVETNVDFLIESLDKAERNSYDRKR